MPKPTKNLRPDFFTTSQVWERPKTSEKMRSTYEENRRGLKRPRRRSVWVLRGGRPALPRRRWRSEFSFDSGKFTCMEGKAQTCSVLNKKQGGGFS